MSSIHVMLRGWRSYVTCMARNNSRVERPQPLVEHLKYCIKRIALLFIVVGTFVRKSRSQEIQAAR
jgi:hypothetical protein